MQDNKREKRANMKEKLTIILAAVAVLANVSATRAADKEVRKERREAIQERRAEKVDIDKRIRQINALDNRAASARVGMAEISKQTAIPLKTIEEQHKAHPNVGLAGLFVANELATRTHKPAMQFIRQHEDGKTWTEIATANGESLDTLDSKLGQIETAMRGAK
jgi:hypothetical protein